MQNAILNNIKGDKLIWAIVALLAIFSFLPVYSAASNLAYIGGSGNTFAFLAKHFMHLFLGFAIMSCFLSSFENLVSFLKFSPSGDHLGDLPLLGTPHKVLVQVGKDYQNCGLWVKGGK